MGRPNINVVVGGPAGDDVSRVYKINYLKPNIPFWVQITDANTKYVVRFNYDLDGNSVEIPEGCLIEFDGGIISNGTMILTSDTRIISNSKAFGDNVTIEGGYNIQWDVTWFGAKSAGAEDYNEQITPVNGYAAFDFLITKPESDLAPIVQRMIDAQCYDIYIPKGNWYWSHTVHCNHNFRIKGGYEITGFEQAGHERYWQYKGFEIKHPYFSRDSIKVLRSVDTMLFIGDANSDDAWNIAEETSPVNHRRALDFSNLHIKCYRGSMTAILNGWIDSADIHHNVIVDCGYLVDYPSRGTGVVSNIPEQNEVYEDSGLWKVPRIYNNYIIFIHGAAFRCHFVDALIENNYFNGGETEWEFNNSTGVSTRKKPHSLFFDGYYWQTLRGSFVNNYIDFFYVTYRVSYNSTIMSTNNYYDITTCVFDGRVYGQEWESHHKPIPYTGSISSINDCYTLINNEAKSVARSTRRFLFMNTTFDESLPVKDESGYYPLIDENDYFQTGCYSIFQVFGIETTFIPASLTDVDYIYQGEIYNLPLRCKTHYMIGGNASQFSFNRTEIANQDATVYISALGFNKTNTAVSPNVSNIKVTKFVDECAFDITDDNIESKAATYRSSWDDTYINSICSSVASSNIVRVNAVTSDWENTPDKAKNVKIPLGKTVVENLVPNNTYTIQFISTGIGGSYQSSQIENFETRGNVRLLNIDGVGKARDLGGWSCTIGNTIGTVRYGLIYRGENLLKLTPDGQNQLHEELHCGSTINVANELTDSKYSQYADVSGAYNFIIAKFNEDYDDSEAILNIFTTLASELNYQRTEEHPRPRLMEDGAPAAVYIHGYYGQDRTGKIAALILGLLGVNENDIIKEYDISNFYTNYTDTIAEQFNNMVNYIRNIKEQYAGATFADSVEAYLMSCSVSSESIATLRELLIKPTI